MPERTPTEKKIFTYPEAQALLPEVRRLTEGAYRQIEALGLSPDSDLQGDVSKAVREVLAGWAGALIEQGIEVKGVWLVDFDNGSGYYCWKYPETALDYYHGYEEGFGGRIRIQ